MATGVWCSVDTQAGELTELRLLLELPGLRKLADRGLSGAELAVVRRLASATWRPALSGDAAGYLYADRLFHLGLLELAGDPAVCEIARVVMGAGPGQRPCGRQASRVMVAGARQHCELATMLAGDMASAADDLLRIHICGPQAGGPAPTLAALGLARREEDETWPMA